MYHVGKAFFPYRTRGRSRSNSTVLFFSVCFLNKCKSDDKNSLEKICFSDKFSMHYSINNSRPNCSLVWRFRVCQVPGGGGESIYGWFSSTKEFTYSFPTSDTPCLRGDVRRFLWSKIIVRRQGSTQGRQHKCGTPICIFRTWPRSLPC